MNRSAWNSHQLIFMAKQKFCIKIFSLHSVRRLSTAKKLSEKWKIQKFFFILETALILTICTLSFVKIGLKFFWTLFRVIFAHCASKKFFRPILTKLGMHIVKIRAVQNMKKNFWIFHFSDNFFAVNYLCTLWSEKFLLQNFCFVIKLNWCEFQALRFMRTNFGF